MMLHTMPFNVTGNPTLAIPTGFSRGGLPLGMQIVGRAFDEPTVFRIGAAYEAAAGWINKRPSLELPIAV
jgi:aspartyl-tRNA(Asn)/glutamyl-tRNA(Gln) amidotransferase subunit A